MKTLQSWTLVIMLLSATFSGFIPQTREKEVKNLTPSVFISGEPCFNAFLKNLSGLNALIYIPETNIEKGKSLGLVSSVKSNDLKSDTIDISKYTQIVPTVTGVDKCTQTVRSTFDDLKMIVFVESTKVSQLANVTTFGKNELKLSTDRFKIDGEIHKYSTINIKLTNATTSFKFTPVMVKL
jgi:hypothetical protein